MKIFIKNLYLLDEVHLFNLRTLANQGLDKPSNSALLILHRQSDVCDDNLSASGYLPEFSDNEIKVTSLQRTTLTGNSQLSDVKESFQDLKPWTIQPMRLASLKLNFN